MRFNQNQYHIKVLYICAIVVATLLWLVPIAMMLSVSLMPPDVRSPSFGGIFLPRYSMYNYNLIFNEVPMFRYFLNSVAITVPSVLMVTFFSSLAAYAFSRLRFFGRDTWFPVPVVDAYATNSDFGDSIVPDQQDIAHVQHALGLDPSLYGFGYSVRGNHI